MTEMPQPSSRTAEADERAEVAMKTLAGDASQAANRGVIFHTTAPVVPPARLDKSRVGDWWIVRSTPATVMLMVEALESTKPRFCGGISWEEARNVSAGVS